MKPTVMLFMKADFAWNEFISTLTDATGISPTRGIDAQGISVSRETAFLAALDFLENGKASVWDSVKRSTNSLSHLPLGFLVICDQEATFAIMQSRFSVTRYNSKNLDDNILVITGGLDEWKDFTIRYATALANEDLRYIANCVYLVLQQLKLDDLFAGYKRRPLADQTFILDKK